MSAKLQLLRFFVSPGHNFFGHHGQAPGDHPIVEPEELHCIAGRGLVGDRYFDHEVDYKGQITFFADEVYQALRRQLGVPDKSPSVFRRNVLTRGLDLNTLIGQPFELQGVQFSGVEECKPCHWMDRAFAPGAEAAMQGGGGLRARILNDGILRRSGDADEAASERTS